MRRVVITGLGLVTPVGIGLEPTWSALLAGKSGAAPTTLFDVTGYASKFSCEVKDWAAAAPTWFDKRELKHFDRFLQFGVAAALSAMDDAGFADRKVPAGEEDRWGCYIGAGLGGVKTIEDTHDTGRHQGAALRLLAVLRHRHHHQHGAGDGDHPHWRPRPQLLPRLGVLVGRPLDRRGHADDPPRLRRRHDRRRHRGHDLDARGRRLQRDAGDVDPQRRSDPRVAALRQGPRRLRHRRGRRGGHPRGATSTPGPAARASTARSAATRRARTRTTSPRRPPRASARSAACARPWPTPTWRRPRSATSTPTAPRPTPTTRTRPRPSRRCSATTPSAWRCRRPSR
jgi:hypothetical protein